MIQDIYPHVFYNQYDNQAVAEDDDYVINICNGNLLLNDAAMAKGEIVFPKKGEFKSEEKFRYIFSIDETRYFLVNDMLADELLPDGFKYFSERGLRVEGVGPDEAIFAATTAKHLSDWYRDTQFCGRCGKKMHHSKTERAMSCECGYTAYPRIMPAVIVGVTNGDKILITRYKTGFQFNALIAGFTEIGETVEETVAREVMEEAGVKVKNLRYYKSQPWGSANDILLGFYCDVDGDDTIKMDKDELKYAEWVQREDIVLQPGTFSLTNEMMKMFKDGVM